MRTYSRSYLRRIYLLEKVFPDRNTRNHGVWPQSTDPPLYPISLCKSEKKTYKF